MLSTQMRPSKCQTTGRKPCSRILGATRWGQPGLQGPADPPELPSWRRGRFQPRQSLLSAHPLPDLGGFAHPSPRGSTLTSAPRAGTPGCRQGRPAEALRSGSRCSWPVALNQMLGVKRGEFSELGTSPGAGTARGRVPAPRLLPESAGLAPDPPLLPLPQLSLPPGAKSWLLESIDPGCGQKEGHERVGCEPTPVPRGGRIRPGSAALTLVIFVSRLVSMGRLPLLMGTVFQPSSATRLLRPPGHRGHSGQAHGPASIRAQKEQPAPGAQAHSLLEDGPGGPLLLSFDISCCTLMFSRCSSISASLWIWSMVLGPWSPRRGTQLCCRGTGRREGGTQRPFPPLPIHPAPEAHLSHHSSPRTVAAFGARGLGWRSSSALNSCQLLCARYRCHATQGPGRSMVSPGLTYPPPCPQAGCWHPEDTRSRGDSRPRALPA